MTRSRTTAFLAASVISLVLTACAPDWNAALTTSSQDNHAFVDSTGSKVDRRQLENANNAYGRDNDPNKAVTDVWGRPNGGTLSEINVNNAGKGSNAPRTQDRKPSEPVQPVEIQFVDTSLRSVIDLFFEQYLKKPYSIQPDFRDQKVNWIVSGSFTNAEIQKLFETFLETNGTIMSLRDGTFFIGSQPQKAGNIRDSSVGQTTGIWRLEHIDARDLVPMVRNFVSTPERVLVLENSNILIVTANGNEVRNVDSFMSQIDVPTLDNHHVLLYSPRFVSPQALVSLLDALPKQLGSPISDPKKVIDAEVIQGTNNVVIVTRGDSMKKAAIELIHDVDQEGKDHRQVFYYTAKNQKAEEIRTTLDQVIKNMNRDQDQNGAVSIISNAPTNSLVITATADEYYRVKKIIDRIDFSVPSLLLDAAVVEVSLNNDLAYGVEWYLRGKIGGQVLNFQTTNVEATPSKTLSLGSVGQHSDIVATLNALSQKTKVQVLSRPRVVVRNKEKATIKSVREIRILKTTSNSAVSVNGATQLLNEYDSKEVGITLEVTPTIADDGTITMTFHIIDSSQGPDTNSQPSFDKREMDTQFVVNSGETIFLGGVIKQNNQLGQGGVPVLGDVPVLGNLFSGTNASTQASELIILVTPYVYSDKYAARILTDAYSGFFKADRPK